MGIYRTPDGRGAFHVKFSRRKDEPAPCQAPRLEGDEPRLGSKCGRMSLALCDAGVGVDDRTGKPTTCDMPLCEKHRVSGGPNLDYCPRHQHLAPATLPLEAAGKETRA